jgi:hypothetical protein
MGFWDIQLKDIFNLGLLAATIVAIVYGPIKAFELSRQADEIREKRRRQHAILHNMMRTRAQTLHVDHVSMLNLVQLEFYGEKPVQEAFQHYMEHLTRAYPQDKTEAEHFMVERRDRLYSLIVAMAKTLGFDFDKSELQKLTYMPIGWTNDEVQLRALRQLFIELLEGRRPLPTKEFQLSDFDKRFPPAPSS